MNNSDLLRYYSAGYTHIFEYDQWLPILHTWATGCRIPTTLDAVVLHEAACAIRMKHGEIRNVRIIVLADSLP